MEFFVVRLRYSYLIGTYTIVIQVIVSSLSIQIDVLLENLCDYIHHAIRLTNIALALCVCDRIFYDWNILNHDQLIMY